MKTIIKRNLTEVPYDAEKIRVAIRKSFVSVGEECDSERLDSLIEQIEMRFHGVEMTLIKHPEDFEYFKGLRDGVEKQKH